MPGLARVFELATKPHPRIVAPEERRVARLFIILALLQFFIVIAAIALMQWLTVSRSGRSLFEVSAGWVVLGGAGLILVAYGWLRTGWFKPGVILYIATTAAVAVVAPFCGRSASVSLLAGAVVPVLLTAMVFPPRWALAVLSAITVAVLATAGLVSLPTDRYLLVHGLLVVVAVVGALVIVFRAHIVATVQASERQLRSSEEQYRNLFETVTDGIFITGPTGRILEVNAGACRQLGYTRDELCALSFEELIVRSDRPRAEVREEVMRAGFAMAEAVHRHRNGSEVAVELVVSRAEYRGEPAFLGVARDVSARNRALREKQKLEEHLARASKLESIGRLAGGVAHDFNNLLTAIISSTGLARLDSHDQLPIDVYLAEIEQATECASALTRQLLAFSREQVIQPAHLDLNLILSRIERMLVRVIGEDITILIRPGEALGTVFLDPGVVEQCVLNLAVNGRDAMPDGGQLVIQTRNAIVDADHRSSAGLVGAGEYVVLSVTDTGVGMSDEVKQRLFEPFFTTKRLGRGTGLGLATVYGAVKQSGGYIEFQSVLGKGTSFELFFPRVELQPARPVAATSPLPPVGDETILVVEDDTSVRNLTVQMLARLGYTVLAESSPELALALATNRREPIHLLVTDVVMPGMNGRQLGAELGRSHPETRVLFSSGYTDEVIARHGVLDVGVAYLAKPFCLDTLAAKVRDVLDGTRQCQDASGG